MKRKSIMLFLSILMASSVLTACDKPIKIGPITLGKSEETVTVSPGVETPTEYLYGDIQIGTVLTNVEGGNILFANGIDPEQVVTYLFVDGDGAQVSELEFNEAGTFYRTVRYQVGEELHDIVFVVNVIDPNAGVAETPTQNENGFLGYTITYPECQSIDPASETSIEDGVVYQLPAGSFLNGSVKEEELTNIMFADSSDINYQQPVVVYLGIALASENPTIKTDSAYILYAIPNVSGLKDSTETDVCFIYSPVVDESVLDIESDIRTFGDAGVEYDAGVASAILSAYGPELTSSLMNTSIVANVPVAEEAPTDIMEEIESLPTDVIEDAPETDAEYVISDGDISVELSHDLVASNYESRHPEYYTWGESDTIFSRWDMRVDSNMTINKVIILPDGRIIPEQPNAGEDLTGVVGTYTESGSSTGSTEASGEEVRENVPVDTVTLKATYTEFTVNNYKSGNLIIDSVSTDEAIIKNSNDKYHVRIVPKGTVSSWIKTNMFKESTKVPSDSSKYAIEEGTIMERPGYTMTRYNIKYIDETTGYQESRLYMVTIIPEKAPSDVLAIYGDDVCGEFDENPLNIAKNCIDVISN